MHTMEYEFGYRERIEGVIVAEYEGTAIVTGRTGASDDLDWQIIGLRLDGHVENARRFREPDGLQSGPLYHEVDVELPQNHPLFLKIMIALLQGHQRDEINAEWRQQVRARHRVPA